MLSNWLRYFEENNLKRDKGPFIFYGIGGTGGIWGSVIWKLHDPLKLANFTQMTPPQKGFFGG